MDAVSDASEYDRESEFASEYIIRGNVKPSNESERKRKMLRGIGSISGGGVGVIM